MKNKTPYEKMKEFINKGEVEQPLDFYGLLLHCYDLEDNEETQDIFVKAMEFYNENDGYKDFGKDFIEGLDKMLEQYDETFKGLKDK